MIRASESVGMRCTVQRFCRPSHAFAASVCALAEARLSGTSELTRCRLNPRLFMSNRGKICDENSTAYWIHGRQNFAGMRPDKVQLDTHVTMKRVCMKPCSAVDARDRFGFLGVKGVLP